MAVNDARRLFLCASVGAVLIVGLSGCGSVSGTPSPAPSDTNGVASSSSGASETATPEEEEAEAFPFVLPATCSEFVGAALEAQLLSEGNLFLFGSNGTGLYAGQPYVGRQDVGTPLTCVYGLDNSYFNIEFSVQGLSPDGYQEALSVLKLHEFTESSDGDVKTFALVGGVGIVVAQVNVLRPDSWITIVNLQGGTSAFDETNEWMEIVTSQVYPEP